MTASLATEFAKFRRSRVAWLTTALIVLVTPAASVGLVAAARSGSMTGPSAAKFAPLLEGTATAAHLSLAGQVLTVSAVLAAGFVHAWLFGREFADHTIGSLFGLPVSLRESAAAKLAIATGWSTAATTSAVLLTVAASWVVAPGGITPGTLRQALLTVIAGGLAGLLGTPFGYFAVLTRGVFGAVGALVLTVALSQVLASLGVGAWVPYVVPSLWVGTAGPAAAASIGTANLVTCLAMAATGAIATMESLARLRIA